MSLSPPPNFRGDPKAPPQKHPPTGRGIGIAFLDTGISPVLDFITPHNRIVAFRDFISGKNAPYDDNGHGTHVTGAFDNKKGTPWPFLTRTFLPH